MTQLQPPLTESFPRVPIIDHANVGVKIRRLHVRMPVRVMTGWLYIGNAFCWADSVIGEIGGRGMDLCLHPLSQW